MPSMTDVMVHLYLIAVADHAAHVEISAPIDYFNRQVPTFIASIG